MNIHTDKEMTMRNPRDMTMMLSMLAFFASMLLVPSKVLAREPVSDWCQDHWNFAEGHEHEAACDVCRYQRNDNLRELGACNEETARQFYAAHKQDGCGQSWTFDDPVLHAVHTSCVDGRLVKFKCPAPANPAPAADDGGGDEPEADDDAAPAASKPGDVVNTGAVTARGASHHDAAVAFHEEEQATAASLAALERERKRLAAARVKARGALGLKAGDGKPGSDASVELELDTDCPEGVVCEPRDADQEHNFTAAVVGFFIPGFGGGVGGQLGGDFDLKRTIVDLTLRGVAGVVVGQVVDADEVGEDDEAHMFVCGQAGPVAPLTRGGAFRIGGLVGYCYRGSKLDAVGDTHMANVGLLLEAGGEHVRAQLLPLGGWRRADVLRDGEESHDDRGVYGAMAGVGGVW